MIMSLNPSQKHCISHTIDIQHLVYSECNTQSWWLTQPAYYHTRYIHSINWNETAAITKTGKNHHHHTLPILIIFLAFTWYTSESNAYWYWYVIDEGENTTQHYLNQQSMYSECYTTDRIYSRMKRHYHSVSEQLQWLKQLMIITQYHTSIHFFTESRDIQSMCVGHFLMTTIIRAVYNTHHMSLQQHNSIQLVCTI